MSGICACLDGKTREALNFLGENMDDIHNTNLSHMLYYSYRREWSEKGCGNRMIHGGIVTTEDRVVDIFNLNSWKRVYEVQYFEACRKAGIPEKFWIGN